MTEFAKALFMGNHIICIHDCYYGHLELIYIQAPRLISPFALNELFYVNSISFINLPPNPLFEGGVT